MREKKAYIEYNSDKNKTKNKKMLQTDRLVTRAYRYFFFFFLLDGLLLDHNIRY